MPMIIEQCGNDHPDTLVAEEFEFLNLIHVTALSMQNYLARAILMRSHSVQYFYGRF